jgi:5'(3')-deoxyribonucleotidase
MGMLCITKEKKYKKNFAEFPFANVVFHRMVMIFCGICTFSSKISGGQNHKYDWLVEYFS